MFMMGNAHPTCNNWSTTYKSARISGHPSRFFIPDSSAWQLGENCSRQFFRISSVHGGQNPGFKVLTGINMCSGSLMPSGAIALAAADIQTIKNWIWDGALDN